MTLKRILLFILGLSYGFIVQPVVWALSFAIWGALDLTVRKCKGVFLASLRITLGVAGVSAIILGGFLGVILLAQAGGIITLALPITLLAKTAICKFLIPACIEMFILCLTVLPLIMNLLIGIGAGLSHGWHSAMQFYDHGLLKGLSFTFRFLQSFRNDLKNTEANYVEDDNNLFSRAPFLIRFIWKGYSFRHMRLLVSIHYQNIISEHVDSNEFLNIDTKDTLKKQAKEIVATTTTQILETIAFPFEESTKPILPSDISRLIFSYQVNETGLLAIPRDQAEEFPPELARPIPAQNEYIRQIARRIEGRAPICPPSITSAVLTPEEACVTATEASTKWK